MDVDNAEETSKIQAWVARARHAGHGEAWRALVYCGSGFVTGACAAVAYTVAGRTHTHNWVGWLLGRAACGAYFTGFGVLNGLGLWGIQAATRVLGGVEPILESLLDILISPLRRAIRTASPGKDNTMSLDEMRQVIADQEKKVKASEGEVSRQDSRLFKLTKWISHKVVELFVGQVEAALVSSALDRVAPGDSSTSRVALSETLIVSIRTIALNAMLGPMERFIFLSKLALGAEAVLVFVLPFILQARGASTREVLRSVQ
ncbi:hypothetical protein FVE85_0791 [Porphyridium purpureum]|uniref:Uncharacterized protein n=1 Tax=Porphyridium purpureum TaxID=35688 RepID=A0A5J4Z1N0_PORPP|nr:hypothetical protein FVE85_0791 [Porphyridium purpureum]|eukprot:POR3852..scf208_2